MWGLGCVVWEVYNGVLPRPEQLKAVGAIPKALVPQYVSLLRYQFSLVECNEQTRQTSEVNIILFMLCHIWYLQYQSIKQAIPARVH
jgi:hypothetical protein